ncbi:hypothetical protein FHE74_05460 [Corynebacterium tapiri]|uniref:Uncharacterized protein n=1 Tax=Corynebacterium tapiri TaxID=1448266 RepID=A0A5C4U5X5_9CORY|nr:hypothetical protein FHE74_05460 [Corynebacterium tapiri]
MSERPAEITRRADHGRPIAVGEPGNPILVTEDSEWEVVGEDLASTAENTPYEGMTLNTRVHATLLRRRVSFDSTTQSS